MQSTVIAIMNEPFLNLSLLNGAGVGYGGSSYFASLSDAALVVNLPVFVHPGETANYEFEFLAGDSLAYLVDLFSVQRLQSFSGRQLT